VITAGVVQEVLLSPGTVNYVEGQASIDSHALNSKSIGSAELQPGQLLTTKKGKVEILLTPGVFLRVSNTRYDPIFPISCCGSRYGIPRLHFVDVGRVREPGVARSTLKIA
jgi:hypothetical protein